MFLDKALVTYLRVCPFRIDRVYGLTAVSRFLTIPSLINFVMSSHIFLQDVFSDLRCGTPGTEAAARRSRPTIASGIPRTAPSGGGNRGSTHGRCSGSAEVAAAGRSACGNSAAVLAEGR